MKITLLDTETAILGRSVLQLSDWESIDEFILEEEELILKYNPYYIYCLINAIDLKSIHKLESLGYYFTEFRIFSQLNLNEVEVSTKSLYPYKSEILGTEELLMEAQEMMLKSLSDDRFSVDPAIGSEFSRKRLIFNLNKSYNSFPSEFVLGLFNSQSDEFVAFRSGGIINKQEAFYYMYGISANHNYPNIAGILDAFSIEFLKGRNIKIVHSVSTGFNIQELNRLILVNGFKITSTKVLLRKILE